MSQYLEDRFVRIGREDRWWNRKIRLPIRTMLIVAGSLVVVFFGYIWFGSAMESVAWSITHRSIATYKGWPGTRYESFSVKAPWMWRQEESLGSDQDIKLVHARIGSPYALEWVQIKRDAVVGDGLKLLDRFGKQFNQTISNATQQPKLKMEDFPVEGDLASHFKCLGLTIAGRVAPSMVQCASRDGGRWSILYSNVMARSIEEFGKAEGLNTVLRSLVSQR